MKLLVCRDACSRQVVALGLEPLNCGCGLTGGQYNPDGDTVTIWGDGVLLGFSNRVFYAVLVGQLTGEALWRYREDSPKVTRLETRPA